MDHANNANYQMREQIGKAWKGVVASLLISGAGQLFSGARRRGLIWFGIALIAPFTGLALYSLPFVPGKAAIVFIGIVIVIWLVMLFDSYRPIKPLHWWGWILLIVASIAVSALLSAGEHAIFSVYNVPTASMKPTIEPGDKVLVCRTEYWFRQPRRGDIVIFDTAGIAGIQEDEPGEKVIYDKRIIGLPGDRVEILDPEIRINGVEMKFGDPARPIAYHRRSGVGVPVSSDVYTVPKDKYFVLGDNSYNAYDSRYWGWLSRSAIMGKVVKIYWPWNRMSTPR